MAQDQIWGAEERGGDQGGPVTTTERGAKRDLDVTDAQALAQLIAIAAALGAATAGTSEILNEPTPLANTEYSLALPASIKGYLIRTRGKGELKLTHVSGESGTKYVTIPTRATHYDEHSYDNLTLYFQSSVAGDVVEVKVWK